MGLLAVISVSAQKFPEKELKTNIKEVTVFLTGAQVFETGQVSISTGTTLVRIKGLSPFIDSRSVQVSGEGDFTILSVNQKLNHLSEIRRDVRLDSLRKIIENLDADMEKGDARLFVLKEKQSLLNENRRLGSPSGIAVANLKQALDLYESEISKIKEEEIRINRSLEQKKKEYEKLERQSKELNALRPVPTSEVEIRVAASQPVQPTINISYLVSNAGWYPKYDIRVNSINDPLVLVYKAEVYQNTGVDWKNVKLRFSNGDPNKSGVVPDLPTWGLNYARYTDLSNSRRPAAYVGSIVGRVTSAEDGEGLPGVNVLVAGTSIGTVTDGSGYYSITLPNGAETLTFSFIGYSTQSVDIGERSVIDMGMTSDTKQLTEVVVTARAYAREKKALGYALQGKAPGVSIEAQPMATTFIENQTTVEIEVAIPYTVLSNGEKLLIDVRKHEIDVGYEYFAIPKLDKDAFLVARIINWGQYNLLDGEANLYFEQAYVGRTILNARSMQDTLSISLGRDKSIVIGRERIEQFSKRKAIGSTNVDSRAFKITIRNKKSQPINLTLIDQIPVTVTSDISVEAVELSSGSLDVKSGKVTWKLVIEQQKQKELKLQYEVKYPKREKILLQ